MNPRECPYCGWKTGVIETRKNGTRRRECLNPRCSFRCDYGVPYRFTTEEVKIFSPDNPIYADSSSKSPILE